MTNGNKFKKEIVKKSNAGLAKILVNVSINNLCKYCIYNKKTCPSKCEYGIKAWFDAPCANKPEKPSAEHVDLQEVSEKVCDNVNHPDHYNHGKIEVIDFIEDKELGFHLGNAVKYISRAGRKNSDKTVEDLRKAVWYINRQIQRLEREQSGQN